MRFSIIIPCYNVAKYIDRALKSLHFNHRSDVQVIIVDDGSTDDLEASLIDFIHLDNFIFLKQDNYGVSYTRNRALKYATGDYIYFFDGDDEVSSDFFYEIDFAIDSCKNKPDIISFSYNYYLGNKLLGTYGIKNNIIDKNSSYIDSREFISSILRRESYQCMCSFVVNRKLLEDIDFNEKLKFYEDLDFQFKLLASTEKLIYIDKVLFNYHKRSDSTVNKAVTDSNFDVFIAIDSISNTLRHYNLEPELKYFRSYTFFWLVKMAVTNGLKCKNIINKYNKYYSRCLSFQGNIDKKTLFVFICSLLPKVIVLKFIKRFIKYD